MLLTGIGGDGSLSPKTASVLVFETGHLQKWMVAPDLGPLSMLPSQSEGLYDISTCETRLAA